MSRPVLTLLLASFALAATAGATWAATINVGVNEARRIMLGGTAANVVVVDTKVADVSMFDAHSVIVTGKDFGSTGLLVTDRAGHTLLDTQVMVSSPDAGHVSYFAGPGLVSDYACGAHCQYLSTTNTSGHK